MLRERIGMMRGSRERIGFIFQAFNLLPGQTPFDYQEEMYGLRDFAEAEFAAWVDARVWNTGDGAADTR